jgi:hypothetical protein
METKYHIIVKELLDGRSSVRIPIEVGDLFPLQNVQTDSGANLAFSFNGYRQIYAGNGVGKQSGCDAYHALPYSAEIKNEWSPTSTPLCLHRDRVYRDSCTFI